MNKNELNPELVNYIFVYCREFMTGNELQAYKHSIGMFNVNAYKSKQTEEFWRRGGYITDDKNALDLLNDGFEAFKNRAGQRIYKEHKDELDLNLCPECGKIARTPKAQQCRYCSYNWYENR